MASRHMSLGLGLITFVVLERVYPHLLGHLGFDMSLCLGFSDSSVGKESTCNAGDPSSILGLGRSPGEGIGYPLQCSGLENSMDCIVHGVAKSRTRLSDLHCILSVSTAA